MGQRQWVVDLPVHPDRHRRKHQRLLHGLRYDNVGNLTNVDYPVGTFDVSFTYDALDRLTKMVDASGTNTYT